MATKIPAAFVTGDDCGAADGFATAPQEMQPVLKALKGNGINVAACCRPCGTDVQRRGRSGPVNSGVASADTASQAFDAHAENARSFRILPP